MAVHLPHSGVAEAARSARGVWHLAGIYPSAKGARAVARRVPRAECMPAYGPSGAYEAYAAPHEDGGTAMWVRYVSGIPAVPPQPATMTYRVCDRGDGTAVGVRVVTVRISSRCPRCGGPRGEGVPHRFHEDGDWYVVDTWTNRCGHVDMYEDVLREHRALLAKVEQIEQIEQRQRRVVEAGEYTDPVLLLTAAAAEVAGLDAAQGAMYLDVRGHHEAARRVLEELRHRHGHMSARQAARYLTTLAAARAACTDCDEGCIDYRGRDGEFVSLRCTTCRREVTPLA